ncbi:MAG: chemotaxis protein CheB [Desulfatibacillaceae bacterium]
MEEQNVSESRVEEDPTSTENGKGEAPGIPYVVGLGASAGGLEALSAFFSRMSPDSGMAFVVIQHLSPDYKSLMVELLSRHTHMTVVRATDGMEVKANSVYLIPPGKNLLIYQGKLVLTEYEHAHGLNLPIDLFLQSLAEDRGERAVGIILSGTGSDGVRGLRAVKEAGGMVMVQDQASARFDGMPRAAVATGLADYILPPGDMPGELLKFIAHPFAPRTRMAAGSLTDDNRMARVIALVRAQTGLDFKDYKPSTVVRRIERRLSVNQLQDLSEYARFLQENPREVWLLYKELLIGVTRFFRDPEAFDALREKVLPSLLGPDAKNSPVRVWVAGCSTGEEAYSVAMLFREYLEESRKVADVKVFATDIDQDAVEFASNGLYPASIAADLSTERLSRYFVKKGDSFQVAGHLREMVVFARHNVMKDPPFARMDLVTCRNMLIYMQPVLQRKILSLFHFAMNPEGALFLGSSESIGELTTSFEVRDVRCKIYSKLPGVQGAVTHPGFSGDAQLSEWKSRGIGQVPVRKASYMERAYEAIVEDYSPLCLVVDEERRLVHVFGDPGDYLRVPSGRFASDVTKMIHKDLSLALSTSLHRAFKDNGEVECERISIRTGETRESHSLRIRVIQGDARSGKLALVFLSPIRRDPAGGGCLGSTGEAVSLEQAGRERIEDLEQEINFTRENLQATVEELETSNEELQATNEELLASNEELQSTNEELQSVNEELHTVNAEHENRIQELVLLNEDMENLNNNTTDGTVFLDERLTIRRINPAATRLLNILQQDVGRPFSHFSQNIIGTEAISDITRVLDKRTPVTREVSNPEGRRLLMRVSPFHSAEGNQFGAVLAFVDVTRLKEVQEELRSERDLLNGVMESSPIAIVTAGAEGGLRYANREAERLLGLSREEIVQRSCGSGEWRVYDFEGNRPDEAFPFTRVTEGGGPVHGEQRVLETASGEKRWLRMSGSPLHDEHGEVTGAVFSMEDLTSEQHLSSCLESMKNAVLAADSSGDLRFVSPNATAILGLDRAEPAGAPLAGVLAAPGEEARLQEAMDSARAEGYWQGALRLRDNEGRILPALASITAMAEQDPEPFLILSLVFEPRHGSRDMFINNEQSVDQ